MFNKLAQWFEWLFGSSQVEETYTPIPLMGYRATFVNNQYIVVSVNQPLDKPAIADISDTLLFVVRAFHDVLFGKDANSTPELNQFEKHVIHHVETLLSSDKIDTSLVPKLPATIMELMNSLNDPEVSHIRLVQLIKRDPALAGDLLRLANSPYFRITKDPVATIEKAVLILGHDGLKSMITTIVMQPMIKINPQYFKMFGQHIWKHSMVCATACRLIAKQKRKDEFMAYLVGLIFDVGKIIVFQCMSNSFKEINPEMTPQSTAFKQIMCEKSAKLTYLAAKEWQLPEILLIALREQTNTDNINRFSALGKILFSGNLAGEVYLLVQESVIKQEQGIDILKQNGFSENLANAIFNAGKSATKK